jgi:hypothetical protein
VQIAQMASRWPVPIRRSNAAPRKRPTMAPPQ